MSDWSYDDEDRLYSTPAISRNCFSYKDGQFYVDQDFRCHPRKDAAELYALLTYAPPPPALTKAGKVAKRQPKDTHKDPEAHFYSAQMAHYGLKVLKTREPAKKKLLAAFSSSDGDSKALHVPQPILELEATLKKEWQAMDDARKIRLQASQEEDAKKQAKWDEEQKANAAFQASRAPNLPSKQPAVVIELSDSDEPRRAPKAGNRKLG